MKKHLGQEKFSFLFVFVSLCCCGFHLLVSLACDFNVLDFDCVFSNCIG